MTLNIQPLTVTQLDLFAGLVHDFYQEVPGTRAMSLSRARAQAEELLRRPDRVTSLLLCLDAEVLGYALLAPCYSNEYGGTFFWLDELYIRPTARGAGVGGSFLEILKGWCQEQGAFRLELEVTQGNTRAIGLYLRHGFELEDRTMMGLQLRNPE